MRIEDLDYDLPPDRIAQRPLGERDSSRLLVVARSTARLHHRAFSDLPAIVEPGCVVVVNDSMVLRARIVGKKDTGGRIEALLARRIGPAGERERWEALLDGGGRIHPGVRFSSGPLEAEIACRIGGGLWEVDLVSRQGTVDQAIARQGAVPLPPYIRREPDAGDAERYQTVYAREPGSAAAPTAGLHFTAGALDRLRSAGHEIVAITLHVGPGTFLPVRCPRLEDHSMHAEWARVPEAAAAAIARARTEGRRILAVGTTVVRTLEAVASLRGGIEPFEGDVDLFIRPGHTFRVVDDLLTNFHLPRSSLLALVMALAGRATVLAAYGEAVRQGYRFYSYGDAMLIGR